MPSSSPSFECPEELVGDLVSDCVSEDVGGGVCAVVPHRPGCLEAFGVDPGGPVAHDCVGDAEAEDLGFGAWATAPNRPPGYSAICR